MVANQRAAAPSFLAFLNVVVIGTARGPKRFKDAASPFQWEIMTTIAPSVEAVRDGQMPPDPRWWIEAVKGSGKDLVAALIIFYLLLFSSLPLLMQTIANDYRQADDLRQMIKKTFMRLNKKTLPVSVLEAQAGRIVNKKTEAVFETLSNDELGGHGGSPQVVVINELTHTADLGAANSRGALSSGSCPTCGSSSIPSATVSSPSVSPSVMTARASSGPL